jgi:ATP-dependent helicase/nuclease subunit A
VGLTRAADRLLVCGAKGVNKAPAGCWHDLVLGPLQSLSEEDSDADGKIWRFRKSVAPVKDGGTPASEKPTALPAWLTASAPPSPPAPMIHQPSDIADDEPHRGAGGRRDAARLRGTLAHRLLQSLPDIPAARRQKTAEEFLSRRGDKLPADQRAALLREVLLVLEHRDFAALFSPGSRAEVPVVGTFAGRSVVGQVDRLAVTQNSILIADFKTNRDPPRRIEDVQNSYVKQLAAYRAVLMNLYPDRPVRAALIWTEVPDLMELSADLLDRALGTHVAARMP